MTDQLPEATVRSEIDRLLGPEVLAWWQSQEGIEWHTLNKDTSHIYGIYMAMLMNLLDDAESRGMNPAYMLNMLCLRVWAQSDDKLRGQIEQFWTFDKGDDIYIDADHEKRVREKRGETP